MPPVTTSLLTTEPLERRLLRSRGASVLFTGAERLGRVMPVILIDPFIDIFVQSGHCLLFSPKPAQLTGPRALDKPGRWLPRVLDTC
jgi:hypothetical protein